MAGIFAGIVNVKLNVQLKWEDRSISEIVMDFGKVNGKMINTCHRETFNNEGNISVIMPANCPEYCARMAAAISSIPFRAIEKMNAYDYETVTHVVSAYIQKRNPKKFYDEYMKILAESDNDESDEPDEQAEKETGDVFTEPASKPDSIKK